MKVAVGISGGVDSAVAAMILKEQGHEVVGVTMTLGRDDEAKSLAEARLTAERLGIELHVFDLAKAWKREVVDYIRSEYLSGRTPNPCVRCNEMVKFGLLPRLAFEKLGCDRFATGHYARIKLEKEVGVGEKNESPLSNSNSSLQLLRAVDRTKDQSYFLYRVDPEILAKTVFPLGGMTKTEVREYARAHGLEVADKGDSQDFCGGDVKRFIDTTPREGNIVTIDGRVLGKPHDASEASSMLRALSGRTHRVYTGVTLLSGETLLSEAECTLVRFRPLDDAEINAYIATGEPMDKAGAYGIQGMAALMVEGIEGDYFNVMGLPLCRLGKMLNAIGVRLL